MPCASLLVRVVRAPLSNDGLRVIGKNDYPKNEWIKRGIWIPRKKYATACYNTHLMGEVRETEKDLFAMRQQRIEMSQREVAVMLLNSEGISKEMVRLSLLADPARMTRSWEGTS